MTLMFLSARTVKIFAAVPGVANVIPPVRSTRPTFRIAETHLTVFLVDAEGDRWHTDEYGDKGGGMNYMWDYM